MAAKEDNDDDRRLHRRERGREGTHENVESSCYEARLRRRLSNTSGVPDVLGNQRKGTPDEESLQEFRATHEQPLRLRSHKPGDFVPDDTEATGDHEGGRRERRRSKNLAEIA